MSTTFTESARIGDVLKREMDALYNREVITVASGNNLALGTVVGIVSSSGEYAIYDSAASNGTEDAVGVLLEPVDATAADAQGVILARGPAVVNVNALVFKGGETSNGKAAAIAALKALGIVARTGIGGAPVTL